MQLPVEIQETVTVTRQGAGAYGADGEWDAGASSGFQIRAYVEHATPKTMMSLPENRRDREAILVITATELFTSNSPTQRPDLLTWNGRTWEVGAVDNLSRFKLAEAHWEAIATRVQ